MKRSSLCVALVSFCLLAAMVVRLDSGAASAGPKGDEKASAKKADDPAVERARKLVRMLDDIYKQTIVLITDKYVHDEDDFAAGSAAVALFANISKGGTHQVRLL